MKYQKACKYDIPQLYYHSAEKHKCNNVTPPDKLNQNAKILKVIYYEIEHNYKE